VDQYSEAKVYGKEEKSGKLNENELKKVTHAWMTCTHHDQCVDQIWCTSDVWQWGN